MSDGSFRRDDLELVVDPTPVECIGGPNDGEFRPVDEDGRRPNGLYVVVNEMDTRGDWRIVARRYVPDEDGQR